MEKFIQCGEFRTICITNNDNCYIWGDNRYGQLGLNDFDYRGVKSPTLLSFPNNEKISFITCGGYHTTCLTKNDNCYTWGNNYYGQLGLGNENGRFSPTILTLPNNEKILFIACGGYHTICLTKNDNCYVWGRNNFGQLGLGDETNRYIPTLLTLPSN